MAKKIFHVGIVTGVMVLLFVFFPDVLVPQVEDIPDAPEAMAESTRFKLPPGFSANIFASDLPGIRVIQRDPLGAIIGSLTSEGKIVVVQDTDDDGEAESLSVLVEGLTNPHGLALRCDEDGDLTQPCSLYVAETEDVLLYEYNPIGHQATFIKKVADLPPATTRAKRALLLDPSGEQLLISIGSSCIFCLELDKRYASVQSLDLTTGVLSTYATGLYNTVFMTVQPLTGEIWGTEMAPSGSSDENSPPDGINLIRKGHDYGWPFCYGANIPVMDFHLKQNVTPELCVEPEKTPSTIDLPAHSGPLGLVFIPSKGWPEEYSNDLLVTYHGPASTARGDGHRIVRVEMSPEGMPTGQVHSFMTGFADSDGRIAGRPVALVVGPDGTLFVSDDLSGRIYRIVWKKSK